MDLRDAHLTPPNDADLLRGAADDLQHALDKMKCVRNGLAHQVKTAMAMNLNLYIMQLDDGASELGKQQAAAVARIVPS